MTDVFDYQELLFSCAPPDPEALAELQAAHEQYDDPDTPLLLSPSEVE